MITAIVLVQAEVDRIRGTQTHIAFRAYSRHDLESAFSLGFDEA
jgi:hypothetical protein